MSEPDQPKLRQEALQLMRYANTLTPYKLDEPLDPLVAGALDDWVERMGSLVAGAAPARHEDLQLYEQLARYLDVKHPRVTYLFAADASLFIAAPVSTEIDGTPLYFPGCFLGLKREGSAEQAAVLDALASNGYIAQTAASFDEACALIDSYLQGVA